MSWDAAYMFGDDRPFAWRNPETGEIWPNPPVEALPRSHAPEDVEEEWLSRS